MKMIKFAATMFAYALAVLLIGVATSVAAPSGAKTATALIVPAIIAGIAALCGVLAMMIEKKRTLGMIGIHLGLIIPLLGFFGPIARMGKSFQETQTVNNSISEIEQKLRQPEGRAIILLSQDGAVTARDFDQADLAVIVPSHRSLRPLGYQAVGLASTAALSGFAFVALLLHRPKVPKPTPNE